MTGWWILASFILGAVSYGLVQPWWAAWRSLPRENRLERRWRRCREALRRADELLAEGHSRLALHAARRAHRIDPHDPCTMSALGQALAACRRYEAAIKHFEEAYGKMECAQDGMAHWAVEAARCCARLRRDARTPLEAETRAEQVLSWARVAARDDPAAADILADDPLLRDLCGQVRLLHAWEVRP